MFCKSGPSVTLECISQFYNHNDTHDTQLSRNQIKKFHTPFPKVEDLSYLQEVPEAQPRQESPLCQDCPGERQIEEGEVHDSEPV